jgi:hypothetical protein
MAGNTWNPQETRWWASKTQTGSNYSQPLTIPADFAGAVDGFVVSGTPYPANDATIEGFIIDNVKLEGSQVQASILVKGIINRTYLPVTLKPAALVALSRSSLEVLKETGHGFIPFEPFE